jgi:tRNA pseudouridine55 synthase
MTTTSEGPDGVLVLDKPAGPTSHDCVAVARRALRTRRVGHAGTLDPFATGVLVLAIGRATRLVPWLQASEKTYEGVIRFGFRTDTLDATGTPVGEASAARPSDEEIREAVATRLTGDLLQRPPMHSAKKRDGVPLYKLARRGIEVERAPVPVRVHGWELRRLDEDRTWFRVTCSAGTYVRVLAEELGDAVSVPAHLETLRRTRSGAFDVAGALPWEALDADASSRVLAIDDVPLDLPARQLDARDALSFRHGRTVALGDAGAARGDEWVVRDEAGSLLGVARLADGFLRPACVLLPA